jgi:hypothetical protein
MAHNLLIFNDPEIARIGQEPFFDSLATNRKMGKKSKQNSPFPFDASTATPYLTSFLIQAFA